MASKILLLNVSFEKAKETSSLNLKV